MLYLKQSGRQYIGRGYSKQQSILIAMHLATNMQNSAALEIIYIEGVPSEWRVHVRQSKSQLHANLRGHWSIPTVAGEDQKVLLDQKSYG